MLYSEGYATNKAELAIFQNAFDVFQFILVFTKCDDAPTLTCEFVGLVPTGVSIVLTKETVDNHMGKKVKHVVIIAAACLNDAQRQPTNDADTISGMDVAPCQ